MFSSSVVRFPVQSLILILQSFFLYPNYSTQLVETIQTTLKLLDTSRHDQANVLEHLFFGTPVYGGNVFIITDKSKTSRGGGKGVGTMKNEDLKLEEIEVSHTLGGYRRCRCYSVVRYTIVNKMSLIFDSVSFLF